MTQRTFFDAEYAGKRKQTRREIFLAEMEQAVPWDALLAPIEPVYPKSAKDRRPCPIKTMPRIDLVQSWFGCSEPAREEALHEAAPLRRFAGLSLTHSSVPNETTIPNFWGLLKAHELAPNLLVAVNTS